MDNETQLGAVLQQYQLIGAKKEQFHQQDVPAHLNHFFITVEPKEKVQILLKLLKLLEHKKVMVFCSTTDLVNYLHNLVLEINNKEGNR